MGLQEEDDGKQARQGLESGKNKQRQERSWALQQLGFFLVLGRLMSLWENRKGRFTEEWRWEMSEVLGSFILRKLWNIREEMSRKELYIQEWRGKL